MGDRPATALELGGHLVSFEAIASPETERVLGREFSVDVRMLAVPREGEKVVVKDRTWTVKTVIWVADHFPTTVIVRFR